MSALSDQELEAALLLNHLRLYGGGKDLSAYLKQGASPLDLVVRIDTENLFGKSGALKACREKWSAGEEMESCRKKGIRLLTFRDPDYPFLLQQIHDPPAVLYVQGAFAKTDPAAVAVVGTRHPSFYGTTQAKKFSQELARAGFTVVSGFAKGIDQIAHEGALEIPFGRTLAVLGCGLDVDYPKGSAKLFSKITERGAVLSEYPLGTPPRAENFPRRNRIISGLSLGVLVVEAHSRSGSLITAHESVEQGREVFAIPGPVDQLTSRGTHKLLKEGAALVETPQDVLEVLASSLKTLTAVCPQSGLNYKNEGQEILPPESCEDSSGEDAASLPFSPFEEEKQGEGTYLKAQPQEDAEEAILKVLGRRAMGYEELAHECVIGPVQIAPLLTRLELRGKIKKSYDGRFSLASGK